MIKKARKLTFSERMGYASKPAKIIEGASPELRSYYIQRILKPLLFIDDDKRYKNIEKLPLGVKDLIEDLCLLVGYEFPEDYKDSWYCMDKLSAFIDEVNWFHFFDMLERIGKLIEISERKCSGSQEWVEKYGRHTYILNVNGMLERYNIGWSMDENGKLQRETPTVILEQEFAVGFNLAGKYEPARIHFTKAIRYTRRSPLDPENAIKEIVSAVESVARIQYPKSNTLGDALKDMRGTEIPPMLILIIEKYYAFANAEPGVRHGGRSKSSVDIEEAELCVQIGVGIIRYLLSYSNEWTSNTANLSSRKQGE